MEETRTVEQIKIHKLVLNPMTDRWESREFIAASSSLDKLERWYEEQKAPDYWKDDRFNKKFKKGSPLEWYNPIGVSEHQGYYSEWVNVEEWENFKLNNSMVTIV